MYVNLLESLQIKPGNWSLFWQGHSPDSLCHCNAVFLNPLNPMDATMICSRVLQSYQSRQFRLARLYRSDDYVHRVRSWFFFPGTLSRANPVCTWLYHLIPDIFKEFGKTPETSEFENNFMHEMIGQYLVMAKSSDGNLKSPMLRFESVQAISQQLCGESRELLSAPGKRIRGLGSCFGDYVSKVDQFIHKQWTKLMENI